MEVSFSRVMRDAVFLMLGATALAGAASAGAGCPGDDSGLSLPSGFCATIFADAVGHARHMVVSPSGVLYVNTWSGVYYGKDTPPPGGFLLALQDTQGTGKANVVQRFGETIQSGGHGGTGIGLYKNFLYAEINDKIVRYPLGAGEMIPTRPAETIVSGLPLTGDHPMHPFAFDATGALLVDVATATNACQMKNRSPASPGVDPCVELETRGGIWKFNAILPGQVFAPAQRYATGIRNAEGIAVDPASKRVYVTQHGRDQLHANWPDLYPADQEATLPAEEILLLSKGADYGWPGCYYDAGQKKLVLAPEYGGDGGKATGPCDTKTPPLAAYPAHWAPNDLLFYSRKEFPAHYRDGLFVAFHGSWDRAPYQQQGYNVVFQPLVGGQPSGLCEIFAEGFAGAIKSPGKAMHRPSGLAVGPDGAMYVSDDVRGRIYRIVYDARAAAAAPAARMTACPDPTAAAGPISANVDKPPEGTDPDAGAPLPVPPGATAAMVALGNRIYHGEVGGASCTGCHGADGSGTPLGPDLSDQQWLWSDGSVAGIAATITQGVAQPKQYRAPMPAMGGAQLSQDQVSALAAYVWGLSHRTASTGMTKHPGEISIPGTRIFPESLTSTADGRLIIGSLGPRIIYNVTPGSAAAEPWISADADTSLGIFGVLADDKTGTLWACFAPLPGNHPTQGRSALKAFDLQTAKFEATYVMPTAGAACNDMAIAPDGTLYATDSANMEIVRLKARDQQLQVWAGDGELGAKGGILDGIVVMGNRVLVNTYLGGKLFGVPIGADGKSGAVAEIDVGRTLERPDGMRPYGIDQVLLVEGGGPGRVSRVKLQGDTAQVLPIKEGFPGPSRVRRHGGDDGLCVGGTAGWLVRTTRCGGAETIPRRRGRTNTLVVATVRGSASRA